ncbi:MAG TPA: beta galactosidase jelly roll domain-containing protein [Terriglobales bacterium]|nr:beta galactosidase jelly roll domain-containing protein [Terriglobales bacterium]
MRLPVAVLLAILLLIPMLSALAANPESSLRMDLRNDWAIQSSCKVPEKGDVISTAVFRPDGWTAATVPNTVLAILVAAKVYPDPYYGMNLRSIPGATYPIGSLFENQPMPDDSPFKCSWWYRTQFELPASAKGKTQWLNFRGINYRANIWMNGKQITNSTDVAGPYRTYEYDVTKIAEPGKPNVIAVEVSAPDYNDLGINWVDWNPQPPDKNMGLWREVYLTTSGPVSVRAPQVLTKLDVPSFSSAELTVSAELHNATDNSVKGTLRGKVDNNIRFEQPVELAAGETKVVTFEPGKYRQLKLKNPRVWWPAQWGSQPMYTASVEFVEHGHVSDSAQTSFGIRQIESFLNEKGWRQFKINGRNFLIRGAGWAPDMMLRENSKRDLDQLEYVRHLNLNTIRLEGKLETDEFYENADRMGIMIMAGWCCCDHWEHWKDWVAADHLISSLSLHDQMIRMRNHPSMLMWLNGSDNPPPADVEQAYLKIEQDLHWPNPVLSSATAQTTAITGHSGVKMSGPYDYVPPGYWFVDKDNPQPRHPTRDGGAFGFNTETSPGPAPVPLQSLKKFIPADKLWPMNEVWDYHAGGGKFMNLNIFDAAMNSRYGQPQTLEDFLRKAQAMAYDGERAMYEAYRRNKYTSTGVIQWMQDNAWPSNIWHLYDYYLQPAGGYFSTKLANEPVHILYGYDDHAVWVVNDQYQAFPKLQATATVYNFDLSEKFNKQAELNLPEDGCVKALEIPAIDGLSQTYFVRLALHDGAGKLISQNFYWLSTQPEQYDWSKTTFFYTPTTQEGNFTALNTLPIVQLSASSSVERHGNEEVVQITLQNPSKNLAFMTYLRVTDNKEQDFLPVFMDDNYITLMPGEKREISARYAVGDGASAPEVLISGWNVAPQTLHPGAN